MSRPPSLPQARPFRTTVFAVRIESPNGAPPAFRCERSILPDRRAISALMNGRAARQERPQDRLDARPRCARSALIAQPRAPAPGSRPTPCGPGWPRPGGRPPPRGSRRRRAAAARGPPSSAPASSSQRVKTSLHGRRRRRRPEPARAPWHGLTDPPRPARRPAAGCRDSALTVAATWPISTTVATVDARRAAGRPWSGWTGPRGSSATRARLRAGSSSEKTSSRSRVGRSGVRRRTSWWTPGAGPGPGSAARPGRRGSGPRGPSSVRTRSSRWGPTVLTPRRRSSVRLAASASRRSPVQLRPVVLADQPTPTGCAGQAAVGGAHQRLEGAPPGRSRAATRILPASASRWSHTSSVAGHLAGDPPARLAQQRGPLAQDPLDLVGRPGALGVEQAPARRRAGRAGPRAAR